MPYRGWIYLESAFVYPQSVVFGDGRGRRKGVNTVGAVFVFLSLLLVLAAAAGETYGEASQDMRQVLPRQIGEWIVECAVSALSRSLSRSLALPSLPRSLSLFPCALPRSLPLSRAPGSERSAGTRGQQSRPGGRAAPRDGAIRRRGCE
jgi:hypothetical protein